MTNTLYYSGEVVGSPNQIFFDGLDYYTRLSGLNGLDGWLKKIGRSIGKTFKQAGNQVKKIGRKSLKAVTKVTMKSLPVIHKALPIVNTALTFVPGVGWAAKAGLTALEIGLDVYMANQKKKEAQKKAQNKAQAQKVIVNKAIKLKRVKPLENKRNDEESYQQKQRPVEKSLPRYTGMDYFRIQKAVNKDRLTPNQVANLLQQERKKTISKVLY